jgi:tetratricopeptide (TPR) repeat protein
MTRKVLVLMVLLVVPAAWALRSPRPAMPATAPPVYDRPPYDPMATQRRVEQNLAAVHRDPQGAIGLTMLSSAYLQRCRETGDVADARRAEQAARHSMKIRTRRNAAAYQALGRALFTQHEFQAALAPAKRAVEMQPDDAQARSLVAEIEIESGDYDAAASTIRTLGTDLTGLAIRARLLEIEGQPENAIGLLTQASRTADLNPDVPRENAAWFHMRIADCAATIGQTATADREYDAAIALFPRDYKSLAGKARLAAGRRDWRSAVSFGERSLNIVPQPEVMALVGDAHRALGEMPEADRYYRLIDTIAGLSRATGAIYDRQRALYCADHRVHPEEALRLARRELQQRHDVFAYDTLAWVCCRTGKYSEAERAIKMAMARHTRDGRIYYHAGVIAMQRGERDKARNLLAQAVKICPTCVPFADKQPQALLAEVSKPRQTARR